MPRLQPPPGYTTASDAASRLGVSDALLSRYVREGKLHRYGPAERKHKFYKISEIEALLATERLFPEAYTPGDWRKKASSTFRQAREADLPAILAMSERAYPAEGLPREETWRTWMRLSPESFQVLRNSEGQIVAYATLLVMRPEAIAQFIRNQLPVDAIGAAHLERFQPGKPLHLYAMSIVVDPQYSRQAQGSYGARLISGLFSFLLECAERGIDIETITARSHTPDGVRLTRKLGFPQIKSPVPAPGRHLFVVNVKESGLHILERYSELLDAWKQRHA